ncbi:hypothetical protein D3C86_1649650 [compost metagenome]
MLRCIDLSETHGRQIELAFLREAHQMSQTQFAAQRIDGHGIGQLSRFETCFLQCRRFSAGFALQLDAPSSALDIRTGRQRHFDHPVTQRLGGFAGDDHFVQIQAVTGQRRGADRFEFEREGFVTRYQSRQATGDGHGHRIDWRLSGQEAQCRTQRTLLRARQRQHTRYRRCALPGPVHFAGDTVLLLPALSGRQCDGWRGLLDTALQPGQCQCPFEG